MTRLTTRDYKKPTRSSLELARWREFGAGLLVGAVATAVLFAVTHRHQRAVPDVPRPEAHRAQPADAGDTTAETAAAASSGDSPEHYDFYKMLPHFEVVVPEKEHALKPGLPTAAIERPGVYVLQAGSYRNEAEADRVAKQLTIEGVTANVQRVAVDTDVWYRVRVGPISKLSDLNRLRHKLQSADVDALVIRVGD
ncbi:MAG: SPOR domain-containing protein [Steroidobacteraceae bacterium]